MIPTGTDLADEIQTVVERAKDTAFRRDSH